jgi:hypothetical protein
LIEVNPITEVTAENAKNAETKAGGWQTTEMIIKPAGGIASKKHKRHKTKALRGKMPRQRLHLPGEENQARQIVIPS